MWKALASVVLLGGGLVVGHLLTTKKSKPIKMVRSGDMVQWVSRGSFVFEEPRKVNSVHDSDMGIYVFVEGSATGIPIDQVVLIKSES